MRVLEVVQSLEKGGRTKRIADTVAGLRALEHDVTLLSLSEPDAAQLERFPVLRSAEVHQCGTRVGWRDVSALRRLIAERGVEVVHAHCERSTLIAGLAARLAGRRCISTFHRSDTRALDAGLSRFVWSRVPHQFVAVSENRRALLSEKLGVGGARVVTNHGGVDAQYYREADRAQHRAAIRRCLNVADDALLFLGMGHLGEVKGHDDSITALASVLLAHSATLVIAGAGADHDRRRLMELCERLGVVARVRLIGPVNDPERWMMASDVFVQPSRDEAFGLVFAEAGAAALPVLATQVGGIPEIIEQGVTGLLVPARDCSALREAADRLAGDVALRERLGTAGRARVVAHFTLARMVERYAALFAGSVEKSGD